jgi:spermidine/putrescine transport system ATP-binding protein
MSDQIAVMNEGKFDQIGSPQDLYYQPNTPFVAGFVGDSNRWTGVVEAVNANAIKLRTKSGVTLLASTNDTTMTVGQEAEIFVRPEAIEIAKTKAGSKGFENTVSGTVSSILFNGANSRVLVKDNASGGEIDVSLPQSGLFSDLQRGQSVNIAWSLEKSTCFAKGEA